MQSLTILGATGSIGESTVKLLKKHPEKFKLFAATAYRQVEKMWQIIQDFAPEVVVMVDAEAAKTLQQKVNAAQLNTEVLSGEASLLVVAKAPQVSIVVAGIVGIAGLPPVIEAVKAKKRILLANKEALVVTGQWLMQLVNQYQATLLPTDSEHHAVWECMPADFEFGVWHPQVDKLILTASGGPFRTWSLESLKQVTPAQAIKHPTWSMGPKISTDCATLINKGLEVIEACWLFGATPEQVDILIHPQSAVHALVQYTDGHARAHMGPPDMQIPIAYGLAWPERIPTGVPPVNWATLGSLQFEQLDEQRFPAVALAKQAFRQKGAYCLALNAANEQAVAAFLNHQLPFLSIVPICQKVLESDWQLPVESLEGVMALDQKARVLAQAFIDVVKEAVC